MEQQFEQKIYTGNNAGTINDHHPDNVGINGRHSADHKPMKLPDAWPSDGRSRISMRLGIGWVLTHPERPLMLYADGKWQEVKPMQVA